MSDAPSATPTRLEIALSGLNLFITSQNAPTESSASPTTSRPVTAPPLNAAASAFFRLIVAPCVVRTFASTATRIPMKPAASEQTAPSTNPIAVSLSLKMATSTVMMTAITAMDFTCLPR